MTAHAAHGQPTPARVLHTAHGLVVVYDTKQILALSGVQTKTIKQLSRPSQQRIQPNAVIDPGGNGADYLAGHVGITFTYYDNRFLCAFGSSDAEATPNADITLTGDLYYDGTRIDGSTS